MRQRRVGRISDILQVILLPNRTLLQRIRGSNASFGPSAVPRGGLWQYGDIVRLLLTQVVVWILDRFALLSGTEPAQVLPAREEILEPPVIAHDAVDDTSARAHDLSGQQNDCV